MSTLQEPAPSSAGAARRPALKSARARFGLSLGRRSWAPRLHRGKTKHSQCSNSLVTSYSSDHPQLEEWEAETATAQGSRRSFWFSLNFITQPVAVMRKLWTQVFHIVCLSNHTCWLWLFVATSNSNTAHWFPGVTEYEWIWGGGWGVTDGDHAGRWSQFFFLSMDEHSRFCDKPPSCPPGNWMAGEGRLCALWRPCSLGSCSWISPAAREPLHHACLLQTWCWSQGAWGRGGGSRDI